MNLLQIFKMVLWSLFGIRSSTGADADMRAFRPAHVFAVAIFLLAAFLAILLTIVHTAISSLS
ncbi:MAG TPA: DUF2970 domain-containing protein [Rhodocyclaceae bacterium]|nr:DUF2970 domain-containing protein [Rhodocyclaceae bacterium]